LARKEARKENLKKDGDLLKETPFTVSLKKTTEEKKEFECQLRWVKCLPCHLNPNHSKIPLQSSSK